MDVVLVLMSVHILNELVHAIEGHEGQEEGEVSSPGNQQIIPIVIPHRARADHLVEGLRVHLYVHLVPMFIVGSTCQTYVGRSSFHWSHRSSSVT